MGEEYQVLTNGFYSIWSKPIDVWDEYCRNNNYQKWYRTRRNILFSPLGDKCIYSDGKHEVGYTSFMKEWFKS